MGQTFFNNIQNRPKCNSRQHKKFRHVAVSPDVLFHSRIYDNISIKSAKRERKKVYQVIRQTGSGYQGIRRAGKVKGKEKKRKVNSAL